MTAIERRDRDQRYGECKVDLRINKNLVQAQVKCSCDVLGTVEGADKDGRSRECKKEDEERCRQKLQHNELKESDRCTEESAYATNLSTQKY